MSEIDNTYLLYKSGIIIDKSVTSGVVVVGVQKDTPAAAASLEKGDVVAEIDGTKIDSVARLRYTLYKYSVGDKIKVKYYRGKDLKEVTVTLNKAS